MFCLLKRCVHRMTKEIVEHILLYTNICSIVWFYRSQVCPKFTRRTQPPLSARKSVCHFVYPRFRQVAVQKLKLNFY